jgi:hypothetical protein
MTKKVILDIKNTIVTTFYGSLHFIDFFIKAALLELITKLIKNILSSQHLKCTQKRIINLWKYYL